MYYIIIYLVLSIGEWLRLEVIREGDNFEQLKTFHTTIEEKKLEELLTILVTHFENIDIVYDGYSVEEKKETKQITPAVIF